jgi:hypothetical protein
MREGSAVHAAPAVISGAKRLLFLGAFLIGSVGVVACSGSSPVAGSGQFSGREVFRFSSLPEMVATSDLVVFGTVAEVGAGRSVGPPEEAIQYGKATLSIEEVFKGSVEGPSVTVETLALERYEPDWRRRGTSVIVFLADGSPTADGAYYLTNHTQSVFIVEAGDLRPTSEDAFATQVSAMSLNEFRNEVANAKERIARGEVAPQQLPSASQP